MKVTNIKVIPNDRFYELALAVEDEGQTYTATTTGPSPEVAMERALNRIMRNVADRITSTVEFQVVACFDIIN